MKFAIPYSRSFKYSNDNIQWNINYKPQIKDLKNFIEQQRAHRINFIISDFNNERDIQIFKVLKENFPESNLVMALPTYTAQLEDILSKQNIPHYYFDEYITDWDKFQGFLKLNVTDIIVTENLLFYAKFLSLNAKKNNKSLRCFCNICQSSWQQTESIKTFFIRPDDIELYAEYIDTFEFFYKPKSKEINTLYEIYSKDKTWFGKLKELIVGYTGQEDNKFILPEFGERRLNCGKRCMQGIEPTCHICDRIIQLQKTLKTKKVYLSVDK